MDQYAYVFLLIFAGLLFLAAASLCFSRDPRKNIFFPSGGDRKMSKVAAVRYARQVGRGVALTALVIAVGSVVGLFRPDVGWWIIIAGVISAVLYAIRLSRLPSDPSETDESES